MKKHSIEPQGDPEERPSGISAWKNKLNKHRGPKGGFLKKTLSFLAPPTTQTTGKKYLYLLLDTSASMSDHDLEYAKRGAKEFASIATKKGYEIGLISFHDYAKIVSKTTSNFHSLQAKISGINGGGSTNMTDAIVKATKQLSSVRGSRVIWMVTDGYPDNGSSALSAGSRAKAKGIDIICLGTESADHTFLKKLASRTDLAQETTTSNIHNAMKKVAEALPESGDEILSLEERS